MLSSAVWLTPEMVRSETLLIIEVHQAVHALSGEVLGAEDWLARVDPRQLQKKRKRAQNSAGVGKAAEPGVDSESHDMKEIRGLGSTITMRPDLKQTPARSSTV